jgi:hypothetical protein
MLNRSVAIAGWLTVIAGVGLMAVHYYAGSPDDPEGWFAAVGFGAPFVGAGALCLVGNRTARPMLCVAAGIALVIMSAVSIVMLPLLIAAAIMIAAARDISTNEGKRLVPFLLAALLVAAFGFLVFHQDPATWSTPDGGGGSSNIVTGLEASMSVVAVTVVVLGSIVWSRQNPE